MLIKQINKMKQQEKKKCVRMIAGPMAGVVTRRYKTEAKMLVEMEAAVYVSKGTLRSFLNQYRKSMLALNIAAKNGITDWNELPEHCALATYGNGVTTLYVVPKGMNALDSLKKGYTTSPIKEQMIANAQATLEKANEALRKSSKKEEVYNVLVLEQEAALTTYKALLQSRVNIGTHYFIEKSNLSFIEKSESSDSDFWYGYFGNGSI